MAKKPVHRNKRVSLRQKVKLQLKHNQEMATFSRMLLIENTHAHALAHELHEATKGLKLTPLAFKARRIAEEIMLRLGPFCVDVIEMGGAQDASRTENSREQDPSSGSGDGGNSEDEKG